ncbi:MAG TPA: HAD-IC family P-type ATPase [Candidatus Dormibacteraeota bacterium]|nr:HAD-IC family P-type ATPase [Candidatus Dormibacteraeota bacterium]
MAVAAGGLTQEEVRQRRLDGRSNFTRDVTSRSVGDILKANLLTRFNALLGTMLVVILIVGPIQDAVFGLILVANALIGIAQELRAKVTLDRLAIIAAPKATVVRDGAAITVAVADVVQDDLIQVAAGDEIVVDGVLESDRPIELNEALLTGEAASVPKKRGDQVLGGSFVSAGQGEYRAVRVGDATYARQLTSQARRFQLVRSELMRGINQILRVVTWIIIPTALLLVYSQLKANPSLPDAARASVAGVITLIPEGLVLLTSAALAFAVIRLGRRKVLIQQLAAVEMLARTDVVCFDKTGTLTEIDMALSRVESALPAREWAPAFGALARVEAHPNASMRAIADSFPAVDDWTPDSTVPFSSSRKWSAARFGEHGWWVIGAPDVLSANGNGARPQRGLLLARASSVDRDHITGLEPMATAVLEEKIKAGAATTVRHLVDQGVAIKLISGDHPSTVAAIAAKVGLPSGDAVDGRELPSSPDELREIVMRTTVFGRVTPEQKRSLVRALQSGGHTVAMVGDGVNDVLALKEADLGIGLGGGSSAARAVAACVLTDGSFDALPSVLTEGRRVIGNVERLARLFFTKTVYAFLLAVAVGIAILPFPFLPRQLTLISAFTIGIPAAVLTLAPSFTPSRKPFLRQVLSFAIPVGFVAGIATFVAYVMAVNEAGVSLAEERTVATLVLASIGVWILAKLASPLTPARRLLVAAMIAGLLLALAIPAVRSVLELDLPRPIVLFAAIGITALAVGSLELGDRVVSAARTIRHSPD